jgi:hypothetical protein
MTFRRRTTMKRKIPMTRLIITALIFSLAAILTTLVPTNAEAAPRRQARSSR